MEDLLIESSQRLQRKNNFITSDNVESLTYLQFDVLGQCAEQNLINELIFLW